MSLQLGILWLVAGIVIGVVGWAGATGRLPRQHWAGIRLPSTVRSDEAWEAAHDAGGPIMESGGALVATVGLLLIVFRPNDDNTTLVSMFLAAGLLVAVVAGGVVGVRAARRVP
jgi:hypothetical protein